MQILLGILITCNSTSILFIFIPHFNTPFKRDTIIIFDISPDMLAEHLYQQAGTVGAGEGK